MNRIAMIDLGSNAVRLEIYQIDSPTPVLLQRERRVIRPGAGVFSSSRLSPAAKERVLAVFAEFLSLVQAFSVQKVFAVATSALRDATDGAEFIAELNAQFPFALRCISGAEEASLIAQGILSNEPDIAERVVLIDVGGGSTECSLCYGQKVEFCCSLNIGAVRCQEQVLKTVPPSHSSLLELRQRTRQILSENIPYRQIPPLDYAIGSSGTARALEQMLTGDKNHRQARLYPVSALTTLLSTLERAETQEILSLPGMNSERADIIVAGATILLETMNFFAVDKLRVSLFSLRHGLLQQALLVLKQGQR